MIIYCPRHRGNHAITDQDAEVLIYAMAYSAGDWATTPGTDFPAMDAQEWVNRWCPVQHLAGNAPDEVVDNPARMMAAQRNIAHLVDHELPGEPPKPR